MIQRPTPFPCADAPVTEPLTPRTAGPDGPGFRLINTEDDIAEGMDWLIRRDPVFAKVADATGPWPLRTRADGFSALRDAILSQQVSVASAAAIRQRMLDAALGEPEAISAATEDDLRACGLSRPKVRYMQALARAGVDYDALRMASTNEVTERLLPIPGIGRWTVEIYLMFALHRADVFAADDLALAEAARVLFALPERPRRHAFDKMAEAWSPWRAVAARGLWAYYAVMKQREGLLK